MAGMVLNEKQIEKNIAWLLDYGSAAVKYLTRRNLLGITANSKAMKDLWLEVENSPEVREVFGKQNKDGSWCTGGSWAHNPSYCLKGGIDPYTPKYVTTVWVLPLLGEIGYTASDKRIRKACDYTISNGYFLNPIFNKQLKDISRSQIDIFVCRFAQYLIALGAVDFIDDVKVKKGFEILLCLQRDDGGWVDLRHYEQMGWTRSCQFSTYHAVMALSYSKNPAYKAALIRGAKFILWHLSTKKDKDLRQFYYHGHSMVRELVMFSELNIGVQERAAGTILKWLMTMYNDEEGCFRYTGKPVSKYTKKQDGIDSRVAKYRFYHVIEDDWLTYHMTIIGRNLIKSRK